MCKNGKEISVLVLCYNSEKYIHQCLNSISEQSIAKKIQLVIMDDYSTDDSVYEIDRFLLKKSTLFHSITFQKQQYNKGAYLNLIDGIKHCQGQYIAYMEGDDYWVDKFKLANQYHILESNKNISATTTGCQFVNENGELIPSKWYTETRSKNYSFKDLWAYPPFQTSTLFFKKSKLMNLPHSNKRFSCNDKILFVLLANVDDIYYNKIKTTAYRFHKKNTTNQSSLLSRQLTYQVQANYFLLKILGIMNLGLFTRSCLTFIKTYLLSLKNSN